MKEKKEENIYSQTKPSWPEAFLLFKSRGIGSFGRKKQSRPHFVFAPVTILKHLNWSQHGRF